LGNKGGVEMGGVQRQWGQRGRQKGGANVVENQKKTKSESRKAMTGAQDLQTKVKKKSKSQNGVLGGRGKSQKPKTDKREDRKKDAKWGIRL